MTPLTKILVGIGVVALTLLCTLTFIPYPPAIEEARAAGFSDSIIETGLQFSFERRCFFWAATVLELGVLCVLALTGVSRRLGRSLSRLDARLPHPGGPWHGAAFCRAQ